MEGAGFDTKVARDAYSISLFYFNGDYDPIYNWTPFHKNPATYMGSNYRSLYNGNITAMSVHIPKLPSPVTTAGTITPVMFYNYQYDQLNRIKGMDLYCGYNNTGQAWDYLNTYASANYKERVSYDANGNILKYLRNGSTLPPSGGGGGGLLAMDSLSYHYYAGTNRLRQVRDSVNAANYAEDIDNQSEKDNYVYDPIGNLIEDKHEGINSILWNVYGKIIYIEKTDGTTIDYTYDASGNRIGKRISNSPTVNSGTTWYVRDASGNVMSTYFLKEDTVKQDEIHLYGSSRIGMVKPERFLTLASQYGDTSFTVSLLGTVNGYVFTRGKKLFELSNHLGNVLVTISDRKQQVPKNDSVISYYLADVVTANDYYPGGMQMPGRKYSSSSLYRYGFQNQEIDREFWGGAVAFEYRVEDPRLVRFFSVDPLTDDFQWNSPYAFAENRLIDGVELEGLEWKPTKDKEGSITGYTWSGYNKDGSAVEGTVSVGIVFNKEKGYNIWYSSNKETRSGSVDFMSAGSKEFTKGWAGTQPNAQNRFNVTINYKDNWITTRSFYGNSTKDHKEVTVSSEFWNEDGRATSGSISYNNMTGSTDKLWEVVSPKVYNDPKNLFNSFRYSLGYADTWTGQALKSVYPETLLLPLPKGLNLLGKATGGAKQWFRIGESYSKAGRFRTYGLRWGASPKHANKIGNATLRQLNQDFRKTKIPFKSWRTADPGHFHFWKLK